MAGHDFKKPGLLRAGFQYQDLVAIEILIDFYRQRELYAWVQLDAEDRAFRSIEDVVACRPDGRFELTQVKFTADPDAWANKLSWKWLTTKRDAGSSLLQKWAETTLRHKKTGTLAQAILKTDRVPDTAFAACLEGRKVHYERLSRKDSAIVTQQLGSMEAAKCFFDSFEFRHSLLRLDDFEDSLWSRISSDTDSGGWALFREQVQRWSTRKGQPAPDGRITYIHLRQAFAVERAKPLPQGFLVPATYSVPDDDFDRAFSQEIIGSDGVTVLWGPPGRGKSTYLSHCVARIDKRTAVCIRHHYFLSLEDRSEGRFSYRAIAQSLKHQLVEAIPSLGGSLREPRHNELGDILATAALALQHEGRRLIVVVDGLDHVWRDHRDHEDMEAFFNSLLPLPTNVRLVIGTQKVESVHLPARLVKALPPDNWTELPLMSQAATLRWLRFQDKAGRLNIEAMGKQTRGQRVGAIARAFHEISHGLPLHLIYSFEAAVRSGHSITEEVVAALPDCPSGDIRDYYRSFLERAGPKARIILHVLAGLKFGPPPFAMNECFGRSDVSLTALAEINHLLDYRETEVRPFHGSLFAFLREMPEHEAKFRAHVGDVLSWLKTGAPEYWRWAWMWITNAQLGDPSDLLANTDRKWAIRSLVRGFPIKQVIRVLDHAEQAAFDAVDLPRLLALRSLKARAVDASESQSEQWERFMEVATHLSDDPYLQTLLRTELHGTPAAVLPFIVRSADQSIRADIARNAIAELCRRISQLHNDDGASGLSPHDLAHAIVGVAAGDESEKPQRVLAWAKRTRNVDGLVATYVRSSLLAGHYDNVFAAGERWCRHDIDRDVLAALCFEGLAPAAKPKLKACKHPAIRCWAALNGDGAPRKSVTDRDLSRFFAEDNRSDPTLALAMRGVLYDVFFAALAEALSGSKAHGWAKIPENAEATWLGRAVRALESVATRIAEGWRESRRWPTIRDVYGSLTLEPPMSLQVKEQHQFTAVRLGLADIVVDLCTIARGLDANASIDLKDIEISSASPFWLDELWLEAFSERRLPLHSSGAAQVLVGRVRRNLDSHITEFSDRSAVTTKLALFASDNGVAAVGHQELQRAAGCLLGFGSHKDVFASEVLESLDLLAKNGDAVAKETILELAGEFETITKYTDGDHTGYDRAKYYEAIVGHFPDRVPRLYAHLIRGESWRYAEVVAGAFGDSEQTESQAGRALLETYIAPSEVLVLENISSTGRLDAKSALTSVKQKTGRRIEETLGQEADSDNQHTAADLLASESKAAPPDPAGYRPGRLNEYMSVIRDLGVSVVGRKLVGEWLRYWDASGCAEQALVDLENATSDAGRYLDFDEALDVAFEIALKLRGRSKAFPWLVRAHLAHSGWLRWFEGKNESEARMRSVAKYYPERWQEFISKTSKPVFVTSIDRNGISVGYSRLVYFLSEVGRHEAARTCALEMARVFKAEVADQPINRPEWSK